MRNVFRVLAVLVMATTMTVLFAGSASASQSHYLTFDEFPVGTTITNQFEGEGVLFSGESQGEDPEIREDDSSLTSPVLSGYLGFYAPIHASFVIPGTTTPATAENVSLEVGFIDDPGSTRVIFHTTTGTEVFYADEYGFDDIEYDAPDITGFEVESIEFEEFGFAIDNLGFATPDPPPPPPPPPGPTATPENGCLEHNGSLKHRIWANLKCKLQAPILAAKCGISIASYFPALKVPKTAAGLYDLRKVSKELRPLVKLYNDLLAMKISKNAPKGFRTFGEIKQSFESARSGFDLGRNLVKLAQALDAKDFKKIVEDLEDIAGIKPCLKLLDG